MRVVKRESQIDQDYVERLVNDYKKSKELQEQLEKRTNDMKKELSKLVEDNGVVDDKGHLWLEVGDLKLKRERRVSRSLDAQSVETWAKENGHWDDIKKTIEVLDEDLLVGLAWDNEELAETIQGFYIEKEIWAFKV